MTDSYIARKGFVDAPRDKWPGRDVDDEYVKLTASHPLQWHSERILLEAFERARNSHQATYPKRNLGDEWESVLIEGDMGKGKTLCMVVFIAPEYCGRGRPAFTPSGMHFGRTLDIQQIYTSINAVPSGSDLGFSEIHAIMGRGNQDQAYHSIAFLQAMAALRKKRARVFLDTSKPKWMSRQLRADITRVIMPEKPDAEHHTQRDRAETGEWWRRVYGMDSGQRAPVGSNRYRQGFYTMDGNPWAEDGLREELGIEQSREERDPNLYFHLLNPVWVREASLLYNTFEDVPVGTQMSVDRASIRETLKQGLLTGNYTHGEAVGGEGVERQYVNEIYTLFTHLDSMTDLERKSFSRRDLKAMAQSDLGATRFGDLLKRIGAEPDGRNYFPGAVVLAAAEGFLWPRSGLTELGVNGTEVQGYEPQAGTWPERIHRGTVRGEPEDGYDYLLEDC